MKDMSAEVGGDGSRARDAARKFLNKLFSRGPHFEQCFEELCASGCAPEELGTLLWSTCFIGSTFDRRLVNSGNLADPELRELPATLRALADQIEALNLTVLSPTKHIAFLLDTGHRADERRLRLTKMIGERYLALPGVLRAYSWHLEKFSKLLKSSMKRLTTGQVLILRLLSYVEQHTTRPHYEELVDLLNEGWLICRTESAGRLRAFGYTSGEEDLPKYLTADALAKMYQRWGDEIREGSS